MSARADVLRAYADLRPCLAEIRRDATLACMLNPLAWIAVHGVSLSDYLERIDQLDALCVKCEVELAGTDDMPGASP